MWAHICTSWPRCPIASPAGKRQIPSVPAPEWLGKERIVLAGVRCLPWTDALWLEASHPGHNVGNGSSVATVFVRVSVCVCECVHAPPVVACRNGEEASRAQGVGAAGP